MHLADYSTDNPSELSSDQNTQSRTNSVPDCCLAHSYPASRTRSRSSSMQAVLNNIHNLQTGDEEYDAEEFRKLATVSLSRHSSIKSNRNNESIVVELDGTDSVVGNSFSVDALAAAMHDVSTHEYIQKKKYNVDTDCCYIDTDAAGIKDNYNASSIPIYQCATFKQDNATSMGEYDYSRSGNPSRTIVESHLAKLTNSHKCYTVTSGMAALDVITRLITAGDHIVTGNDLYGGTNRLMKFLTQHSKIVVHHIDTTSIEKVEKALDPEKTKLVLLETPTNPVMKIADIKRIASLVHQKCPSCLVVVDNTMMSPYLLRTLDLGVDIEYHSGTKFLSGHHDLMAGAICCKNAQLAERIYFVINAIGCALDPFDCFLLLRGVKTMALRIEKQQLNANIIAERLVKRGTLKRVNYPALKSHPGHEIHKQMVIETGSRKQKPGKELVGGAVLSFTTDDIEKSKYIVENTILWSISVSFGCVNSLISMPCQMSHASIPAEVRKERGLPEDLIRLCVGIEDVDDLWEDLESTLIAVGL